MSKQREYAEMQEEEWEEEIDRFAQIDLALNPPPDQEDLKDLTNRLEDAHAGI